MPSDTIICAAGREKPTLLTSRPPSRFGSWLSQAAETLMTCDKMPIDLTILGTNFSSNAYSNTEVVLAVYWKLSRIEKLAKSQMKASKNSKKAKEELMILVGKGKELYERFVKVQDDAENPQDALANTLFTSQDTVADGGSLIVVPDFTGYHLVGMKESKPIDKNCLYAWRVRNKLRIVHECSPFFLEIKTSPTRHKPNNVVTRKRWDQDLREILRTAVEDLMFYCSVYLAKDLSIKKEIPEMEFNASVEELRKNDPVWKEEAVFNAAVKKLTDVKIFVLGTKASDLALTEMRDATISIVNNHVAYGPTMLATQPKAKGVVGQSVDEGRRSEDEQYEPGGCSVN
ncbi:hypothetical protein BXZ70DRAFT_1081072 [Cristinia sonorae]|uniref:Uncharacterized protein n=1 Tax=Cristinia sonorae TaxID=1940300 RepID=A0A8K0UE40_9AGAR|nr:hypothetical protein BXZ70DRAFT_1081072 [Cristinia sonorae]